MIVCVCHRVSDRDIARVARAGCDSFDALQDELRVATACGACHDCARATFDAHCATGAWPVMLHGAMAMAAASARQEAVSA